MSRAKRPARSTGPVASRDTEAATAGTSLPGAALALLLGVIALWVLRGVAVAAPGRWLWGVDLGRDLGPAAFGAGVVVGLVGCVPAVWRAAARAWGQEGPARSGVGAWWPAFASALAVALFMWNVPDRTLYTGDASLRHGAFAQVSRPEVVAEQAMRGDLLLHHGFPRWVALHTPWSSEQGGRALGALLAALTTLAGWRLAHIVGARGIAAFGVSAIVVSTGALALDTGYGKASVEIAALASIMSVGLARLASDGRGLGTVGGSLAVALLLHRSSLLLLPAWGVGAWLAARAGRQRAPHARFETFAARSETLATLAGTLAPLAALALGGARLLEVVTSFDARHHVAGGVIATLAAAFAPLRLLDSANTLVFLVPLAPLVLLLFAVAPRPSPRELLVGAAFVLPPLALLLVVHPQHELPRDWDVFAFAGSALAAVMAWRLAAVLRARPSARGLALPLALAAAFPAFQWAALQAQPERAWSRAESILAGPPARRASDVAEGLGTIGVMRMGRGQFDHALRLFERSAEIAPNPRMFVQMGMAETLLGRPDRAMGRYRHAAGLNPRLNAAWRGVAAAASALGDRERMREALAHLEQLEPGSETVHDARAWLEANPER